MSGAGENAAPVGAAGAEARERVCFQLQVRPEHIDAYKAAHAAIWPEMAEALHRTGWHNYSLFLRDDGLLIGYLETPDLAAAQAGMAATSVNARWQAAMSPYFADLDVPADEGFIRLVEVFHLEDQLPTPSPSTPAIESDAS